MRKLVFCFVAIATLMIIPKMVNADTNIQPFYNNSIFGSEELQNFASSHNAYAGEEKGNKKETPIPLEWEGIYDGITSGIVVRRAMKMFVDPFSREDGQITGQIIFSPVNPNDDLSYSGSYKFKGYYDANTGHIGLQGYEWISQAVDIYGNPAYNFGFIYFSGTVYKDDGKIAGMTVHGDWQLVVIDADEELNSGFSIGHHNNNFVHNNKRPSDGFWGTKTYKMSDDLYETLCTKVGAGWPRRAYIQLLMNSSWEGVCYGLSATMGLVFEGKLSVRDISRDVSGLRTLEYHDLRPPKEDEYFRDVLNYYHLCQYFVDETEASGFVYWGNSLELFLNNLVKATRNAAINKEVLLIGGYGHRTLITGYKYDHEKGEYILKGCDPNNQQNYNKMIIKKDFSDFKLGSKNRRNTKRFRVIGCSAFNSFLHTVRSTRTQIESNQNDTSIVFSDDSMFTLTTSSGYSFSHNEEGFAGDLPIHSSDIISTEKRDEIKITTKYFDNFAIVPTSKNIDLTIYNNSGFKAIKGQDIKEIVLSLSGDMKLSGKTFSFKAFTTVDQMLNDREKGMGSVYAKGKGEVIIHKGQDTIEISSEKPISHIETKIYQGVNVIEGTIKGNQDSVVIKPCEETIGTSTSIEDGIIIFSKQGYAYRGRPIKPFVSVYVGGKSLKKNKEFKVQYENNVEIGTGKLTVTGLGEYSGSLSAEFPIVPKKVKVKSVASCKSGFEIKWNSSGPKDGFEIQYDTDPDFKKAKTKKIEDPEGSSAQVEGLAVGTEYFVRIRAYKTDAETGKTYNSNWSDVKSVLIYPY